MKKSAILVVSLLFSGLLAENIYSTTSEWLMLQKGTDARFKSIQKQLRGFDLAMVEVGYRFNEFYFALKDKNYDLAEYHWDKIKKAIENGIIRRPKRAMNSKTMFLDTQYFMMKKALKSKDAKQIWKQYEKTKVVCNACHNAERVPFINVVDPQYRCFPVK